MRGAVFAVSCSLALAILPAGTMFGQPVTTSSISGAACNAAGATVPNLTVILENDSTHTQVKMVTDSSGKYEFTTVAPGTYRITTAIAAGAPAPSGAFQVDAGNAYTINLTVATPGAKPGDAGASTAVVTAQPVLTSQTSSQTAIDYNTVYASRMPQPDLVAPASGEFGAANLTILQAGVTANGIGQGTGPAVAGVRPIYNEFRVDGADNNNHAQPEPLTYISEAATQEVAMFQDQFSPVFGHAIGGQMDTMVRTGANQVHGLLYDYLQHGAFNAVNRSFADIGMRSNPRYDANRLGGELGTPLIHNKLFFFGDFEYIPLGFDQPIGGPAFAPTAAGFSLLSTIPGVSTSNLALLQNTIPGTGPATGFTTIAGRAIPIGPVTNLYQRRFQNQYMGTGNLDWISGDHDSLRVGYTANDSSGNFSGSFLPAFNSSSSMIDQVARVTENHIFSPTVTNQLRLAYNRLDSVFPQLGSAGASFGNNLSPFPNIEIAGDTNLFLGPGSIAAQKALIGTYQLNDDVNLNHRRHNFTFGFDGLRVLGAMYGLSQFAGNYVYSGLEPFLFDIPPDVTAIRSFGSSYYNNSQYLLSGWAQDRWMARPNLTISLGVRYEYDTIPGEYREQGLNAAASVPGVVNFGVPTTQKHNFAPNVGLAWSPGGRAPNRTFVIRGGFGMEYAGLWGSNLGLYTGPVAPQFGTTAIGNVGSTTSGFLAGGGLAAPSPLLTQAALTSSYVGPQRIPYTMQWNFGAETDLWRNATIGAKYMGTRGIDLPVYSELNAVSPVTASSSLPLYYSQPTQAALNALPRTLVGLESVSTNPLAQSGLVNPISTIADEGNSWYHGVGVTFNQRLAGGLQMIGAYTWSHLIDDSTGTPLDLSSVDRYRATSLYDRRQRFTLSGVWDTSTLMRHSFGDGGVVRNVLGGWMLSGSYMYQTPQELTALGGGDADLLGYGAGPALFNASGTPGVSSGLTPLTNAAGNTVAYQVNNPNAQFIQTAPGVYAPGLRSDVTLGHVNNFDVALAKSFTFHERYGFTVRADAFNLFNHPQFIGGPVSTMAYGSLSMLPAFLNAGSASFGDYQGYLGSNPRMLDLALRLTF